MELLSEPKFLVLDEPASGLDSTSAVNLVSTLRKIADEGCGVVFSVHAPSVPLLNMFDSLMVLSPLGRVGYRPALSGAVEELLPSSCDLLQVLRAPTGSARVFPSQRQPLAAAHEPGLVPDTAHGDQLR